MNNHCQLPGPCSLLGGPHKMQLSSGQVPGNCLFLGYPAASTTNQVCALHSSSTQSSSHIWSLGAPTRDHSPLPPPVWWPAPLGSALCLASALVMAPDQGLQRAAQLPGLLPMSTLGHGRWPINVVCLDWVLATGLGCFLQPRPYGIFDSALWTFFLTGPCFGNGGGHLASSY